MFFNKISQIFIQIFYLQKIYRHVINVQVRSAVGLLFAKLFGKVVRNKQWFKIFKQFNQLPQNLQAFIVRVAFTFSKEY